MVSVKVERFSLDFTSFHEQDKPSAQVYLEFSFPQLVFFLFMFSWASGREYFYISVLGF